MTVVFQTVLYMSASAGVLALLVLGARALFGRRQTVMLTVLFALLIAKLVIPLSIESPMSLQNLIDTPSVPSEVQSVFDPQSQPDSLANAAVQDTAQSAASPSISNENSTASYIANDEISATNPAKIETQASDIQNVNTPWQPSVWDIAAIVWLAGMAALGIGITWSNVRFARKLKQNRAYTNPRFDALLKECHNAFGLTHRVPAIQVSEINTAAVYGVVRPRLMISPRTFDKLSETEQRHVIMHELSHIKRKDTLICLIITILNVIHWFNPIVWFTFLLMRKDIEVMCDAKVLKKLENDERRSYAATLFGLIQKKGTKSVRLVTALFMSKSSIKRRITMIARYKKNSPLFIAIALLLTVAIAVTGCTGGMQNKAEEETDTQEPAQTVQASYSVAEVTPIPTPENFEESAQLTPEEEQLDLLATQFIDLGEYVNQSAFINNIEKAANLLDGAIFAPNQEIDLYDYIRPITEESGWQQAAPVDFDMNSEGWIVVQGVKDDETRVGSGAGTVVMSVFEALQLSNLDISLAIIGGSNGPTKMLVTNNYKDDITIRINKDGAILAIEVYIPSSEEQVIKSDVDPVLMTSFSLDYSSHLNENTKHNIEKALGMLNGAVITPDGELSLNTVLGPRNEKYGWKQAAGISGGAFVQQYGGGVSAVSNALYNAAIRAELEIIEHFPHSIVSDYVPGGLDATISTGGPDLVIANPYDIDVTINCRLEEKNVIVEVYGPPRDYTVDFTSKRVATTATPEPVYYYNEEITPDGSPIPQGESVWYIKSRGGHTFDVYKSLYDLDGNEIATTLFYTCSYRSIRGQIYVNEPAPNE